MDESTTISVITAMSGVAILWRIVFYQGMQITKLTKRLDELWDRYMDDVIDTE